MFNLNIKVKFAISIHAAREGGDVSTRAFRLITAISIHAAREGGDIQRFSRFHPLQSISIHAAREGGDIGKISIAKGKGISIHAAREGGDCCDLKTKEEARNFNPRRP